MGDMLLVSNEINRDLYNHITKILKAKKSVAKSCTMFLTTYGGDPHAGYRIARCLRYHYEHLRIVIPSYCKSAGTLIAISANELAIGNTGELGPLDMQVSNPNEMQGRSSGLDIQQALTAIDSHATSIFLKHLQMLKGQARLSTRLAGELATELAIGQTTPLYSQIDPLRIGELQRAMQISISYGDTLNEAVNNLKPGALNLLISDYPAHEYVIDRKEAGKLFERVSKPTSDEDAIYANIMPNFLVQSNYVQLIEEQPLIPGEKNDTESTTPTDDSSVEQNAELTKTNSTNTRTTGRKKPKSSGLNE
jgi:hypothetical protein